MISRLWQWLKGFFRKHPVVSPGPLKPVFSACGKDSMRDRILMAGTPTAAAMLMEQALLHCKSPSAGRPNGSVPWITSAERGGRHEQ